MYLISFFILLFFPPLANEEYYQMMMINDSQPPGFDVSSYTIEEINSITSEYTLKTTVRTSSLLVNLQHWLLLH